MVDRIAQQISHLIMECPLPVILRQSSIIDQWGGGTDVSTHQWLMVRECDKSKQNFKAACRFAKRSDGLHPTNGYHLLDGRNELMPYAVVQCGCFKGTTRDNFIDRKEFCGPIDRQIEDAYNFLLHHLNMGTTIQGFYRKDEYELPVNTIRELFANAYCNRTYLAEKKIQVMLYSDRLEITSPGRLDEDLTIEELRTGVSKIRNKALAMAFSYMFLVEGWGTGIPKMYEMAKAFGLKEPVIITQGNSFRVNLFRRENINGETDIDPKKNPKNDPKNTSHEITERQLSILNLLATNGSLTRKDWECQSAPLSASSLTLRRKDLLAEKAAKLMAGGLLSKGHSSSINLYFTRTTRLNKAEEASA